VSIVFSPEEAALIDHIAVKIELERLSPLERTLIEFRFAAAIPDDYAGPWPAGKGATGIYTGRKYLDRPLGATMTQERTSRILARWRRLYHHETCRRAA